MNQQQSPISDLLANIPEDPSISKQEKELASSIELPRRDSPQPIEAIEEELKQEAQVDDDPY